MEGDANVFVYIGFDRHGNIVEVRQGDRVLSPRTDGAEGADFLNADCGHDFLVQKSIADARGGGTDPCCVKDRRTGNIFCWC